MPCEQWCRLVARYRSAVSAYHQAVNDLGGLPGPHFNEGWSRAERARATCDEHRAEILQHEHDHACLEAGQHQGIPHQGTPRMSGIRTEKMVLGDQGQSGG